jgi:hypothetical protein
VLKEGVRRGEWMDTRVWSEENFFKKIGEKKR